MFANPLSKKKETIENPKQTTNNLSMHSQISYRIVFAFIFDL